MEVNFNTFGDRATASSRLRAWMLADELQRRGHRATLNRAGLARVEVFQKVRPASRLEAATRNRSRIVYDFDDNYLLDGVGTRDDLLEVFNRAALVTVGSQRLLELAELHHPHVRLFENPLDVDPGARPREQHPWSGRIGWFGNRTNLVALEDVDLPPGQSVVRVTAGGDIEWALETIDAVVAGFDLVLLPAGEGEWTLGKNANRLLKCVALGVPALVSRTPEHERMVRLVGLPEWTLIDRGEPWRERIESLADSYDDALAAVGAARERAWQRYGIGPVAERWLADVEEALGDGPRRRSAPPAAELGALDVVVLDDLASGATAETLEGLAVGEAGYRSVTTVAPPADGDFFELYSALARALDSSSGDHLVVLRAGAVPRRAFFGVARELLVPGEIRHLPPQVLDGPARRADAPDGPLGLLEGPYLPWGLVLPTPAVQAAGGLEPRFGPLALWELLLRLLDAGVVAEVARAPVLTVSAALLERHPIHGYAAHFSRDDPALMDEMPGLDAEWARLRHTLHAEVTERHRELFAHHLPALLPRLAARSAPEARRRLPSTRVGPPRAGWQRRLWETLETRDDAPRARRPVRAAWRTVRPLVPSEVRTRYYRRYRSFYELFFPERRPPRS